MVLLEKVGLLQESWNIMDMGRQLSVWNKALVTTPYNNAFLLEPL